MSNQISKASELVNQWFNYTGIDKNERNLPNIWKEIVESIYNNGPQLASHSRVMDLKNNCLIIEVDHSGWIQLLQMNKAYILKGLKMKSPKLNICNLSFKLSKLSFEKENFRKNEEIKPSRAELLAELEKKLAPLEEQRKYYEELEAKQNANKKIEKKPLDPKLAEIFERMKKNIQDS